MSEHGYGKAVLDELRPLHRELRHAIPDVYKGFGEFHHAAFTDGALDVKTKELIALACGVSRLCEGCIVHHTKAAKAAGATLEEVQDTLDVCVLMGGGPATVFGKKALDAWNAAG